MTAPNSPEGLEEKLGVPASPSGCQPSASAAVPASSQSGIPNAADLSERDLETLSELLAFDEECKRFGWSKGARPMDVGGSNRSHHSATLKRLCRRGLARFTNWARQSERGSCRYWITDEGREVAATWRAQAIEARRAATAKTGAVEDESAVGNADAPKGPQS